MFSAHGNSESERFFEKLIRQTIFFFSSQQVLPSNFFFPIKTSKQSVGTFRGQAGWQLGCHGSPGGGQDPELCGCV